MIETLLTADGLTKLMAEEMRLRAELERLVRRMRTALEFGGAFPENGEYIDAYHELGLLERRIAVIHDRLVLAEVVHARRDGEVEVGERATLLDLDSSDTIDYRVVGSGQSNPDVGEVSYVSPVGAALLGRRVGDVVDVDTPGGRRRFEVVEVDG